MTDFKVGDRVRYVNNGFYNVPLRYGTGSRGSSEGFGVEVGAVGTVMSVGSPFGVHWDGQVDSREGGGWIINPLAVILNDPMPAEPEGMLAWLDS